MFNHISRNVLLFFLAYLFAFANSSIAGDIFLNTEEVEHVEYDHGGYIWGGHDPDVVLVGFEYMVMIIENLD